MIVAVQSSANLSPRKKLSHALNVDMYVMYVSRFSLSRAREAINLKTYITYMIPFFGSQCPDLSCIAACQMS